MIELVPMAWRVVKEVDYSTTDTTSSGTTGQGRKSGGDVAQGREGKVMTEEEEQEERDAVFFRLEMLGYRVGQGLVERFVHFILLLFPPLLFTLFGGYGYG